MSIKFPITECPACHSTQFKVHATSSGVAELTFNADGTLQSTNQLSVQVGQIRKTWTCAQCNRHLFNTEEMATTQSTNSTQI